MLSKLMAALRGDRPEPEMIEPMGPEMSEQAPEGDHGMWEMTLKKKRRAAMMKKMLEDAGYGELSKMINIHEG